jgi:hypothetical protein
MILGHSSSPSRVHASCRLKADSKLRSALEKWRCISQEISRSAQVSPLIPDQ